MSPGKYIRSFRHHRKRQIHASSGPGAPGSSSFHKHPRPTQDHICTCPEPHTNRDRCNFPRTRANTRTRRVQSTASLPSIARTQVRPVCSRRRRTEHMCCPNTLRAHGVAPVGHHILGRCSVQRIQGQTSPRHRHRPILGKTHGRCIVPPLRKETLGSQLEQPRQTFHENRRLAHSSIGTCNG